MGYLAGVPAGLTVAELAGADGLGRAVAILSTGVYHTTADGGQSWEVVGRMPIEAGANHAVGYVKLGPDGHVWATTFRAGAANDWLYRSAEPVGGAFVVSGEASPDAVGVAELSVQPNPTSRQATARLTLSAEAVSATVTLYDALGRRVATLHAGPLTAGRNSFEFNTAALPPGVYVTVARVSSVDTVEWTTTAQFTIVR